MLTHALVQGAALYDANERGLKRFPSAVLGQPAGLVFGHPLMQRAHATKQLVALCGTEPSAGDGRVLAAVPLIAASGRVLAVVAIHQMPFMAFHAEQLDKLAVICARIADLLDLRTRPFALTPPAPIGRSERAPSASALTERDSASTEVERPSRPSQPIAVS